MDATRFDAITKALISETSRRRTLSGLLGGALGLLGFAVTGAAAADDECRPRCGRCERCKQGRCRRKPSGTACGRGRVCRRGACVCPGRTEACDGRCVAKCGTGEARNPLDCTCCLTNGTTCTTNGGPPDEGGCCSEGCFDLFAGSDDQICRGRPEGFGCDFDAQCRSNECGSNGLCTE